MIRSFALVACLCAFAPVHARIVSIEHPQGSLLDSFEPAACDLPGRSPFEVMLGVAVVPVVEPVHVEEVVEPAPKWWQLGKKRKARETLLAAQMKHLGRIDYLDPKLGSSIQRIYAQMREQGYDMRSAEGFRSPERQNALMSDGRGVTSVGAMRSCHQYGLALDSVLVKNGRPQWNMKDPWTRQGYQLFGELAEREGLSWGGRWTHPKDYVHVELKSECGRAKRNPEGYIASVIKRLGADVHLADIRVIEHTGPFLNPTAAVLPVLLALQPNGPMCAKEDTFANILWMPTLTPHAFPLG